MLRVDGWVGGWVPPETRDALLVRAESATVPCGWTRDIISHPLYTSNFLLFLHFSFFEVLLPLCPMCPFHSLFLLCFCFQSNRQDFPICAQLIYTMKSSTFAKVSQHCTRMKINELIKYAASTLHTYAIHTSVQTNNLKLPAHLSQHSELSAGLLVSQ